jgi:ankyrin repeat protein
MCLHAGLKANTASIGGNTLLMEASRNGSYATAKLLLAHGAKVNRFNACN